MKLAALGLAVWALCAGASKPHVASPTTPDPRRKAIAIEQFAFAPGELEVALGDTIEWINHDGFSHTTTADSAAWSSPELRRDQRFVFVATRQGRFAYHCAAHPVMRGVLIVQGRF